MLSHLRKAYARWKVKRLMKWTRANIYKFLVYIQDRGRDVMLYIYDVQGLNRRRAEFIKSLTYTQAFACVYYFAKFVVWERGGIWILGGRFFE